jgi:HPt (histidine-containing phosphotransfer) domain-containing protein
MDGYLSKPFSKVQLFDTIAPWLITPRQAFIAPKVTVEEIKADKHIEQIPIDINALKAIAALDANNAGEIVDKIIKLFLDNLNKEVELLINSPLHNVEEIQAIAHSLKSSCANVGAQTLSVLCKQLEQVMNNQSGVEIQALISDIETESHRVREFFLDNNITSILFTKEQS